MPRLMCVIGSPTMSLISHADMIVRAVRVAPAELVFVRHVLEASEGLGFVVGEKGGDVLIVCDRSREAELDEFLTDMMAETNLRIETSDAHQGAFDVAE